MSAVTTDRRLRRLEREAQKGDPEAKKRLRSERRRVFVPKDQPVVMRSMTLRASSIDEATRTARFVIATERPVVMSSWLPPEVLRMDGVRLDRYRGNPVVLDSHRSPARLAESSCLDVIGSADTEGGELTVEQKGRTLEAVIRYAETDRGDQVWKLVKGGHVRATSIGYAVRKVLELFDGETDGDGDGLVEGPALIAVEWELFEISQTAIPADQDALLRFYTRALGKDHKERPVGKKTSRRQRRRMDDDMHEDEERMDDEDEERMDEDDDDEDEERMDEDDDERMEDDEDEERSAGRRRRRRKPSRGKRGRKISFPVTKEERQLRAMKALHRQIREITPRGWDAEADQAIAEGLTLEAYRERLKAKYSEGFTPPVGTPEPRTADSARAAKGKKPPTTVSTPVGAAAGDQPDELDDEQLVRAFNGL